MEEASFYKWNERKKPKPHFAANLVKEPSSLSSSCPPHLTLFYHGDVISKDFSENNVMSPSKSEHPSLILLQTVQQ